MAKRKTTAPKAPARTPRPEPEAVFRRQVALQVRAEDVDPEKRELQVSFSSETDEVRFFGTPVILLHEEGAADFSRINSVLLNHNPDVVLGRAEGVTLDTEERKGRGTIVFDQDDEAERVWRKVQSGSIRGVSVGFQVTGWANLDEGDEWESPEGRKFTGPAYVARSWQAFEFSLTPIPADGSVGVGRSSGPTEPGNMQEGQMAQDNRADPPVENERTAPKDPTPQDDKATREEAVRLERERVKEIRSLCDQFAETRELSGALIDSGVTVEAARKQILAKLSETRQPVGTAHATVLVDERDKFRQAAQDHLELRTELGRKSKEITQERRDAARDVPCYTLLDLARESLKRAGNDVRGLSREDLAMLALGKRAVGSHTVSDFPLILANVATKNLQAGWQTAPATYEPLVRKRSVPDFKAVYSTKLGDAGLPELTPDGAPMPESSLAETGENYRIYTYAKRFSVTRATIVNDDLDALSRVPSLMGAACRRKINSLFWDLLVSASGVGPTMTEDSEALFSLGAARIASSGINYTTGAAAIAVATLSSSKALMRKQRGMVAAGETAPYLNIQPDFLIVPTALEYLALQMITTITPALSTSVVPEWIRSLRVIVEPSLDAATNGTTAWYLAASPSQIDGFEMAFLDGREEPTLIEVEGTNILGKEWGVYFDAGIKCVEFRGWMRNRGA